MNKAKELFKIVEDLYSLEETFGKFETSFTIEVLEEYDHFRIYHNEGYCWDFEREYVDSKDQYLFFEAFDEFKHSGIDRCFEILSLELSQFIQWV